MKHFLTLSLSLVIASICDAKIVDPPGVYFKGRYFCSHANTVIAVKTKNKHFRCNIDSTDSKDTHKVWETEIPFKVEPEKYKPGLEQDAQWCIVTGLSFQGKDVIASNCEGKKFRLSQRNGKLK